jgi:hypothetical protein
VTIRPENGETQHRNSLSPLKKIGHETASQVTSPPAYNTHTARIRENQEVARQRSTTNGTRWNIGFYQKSKKGKKEKGI